VPPEPRPVPGVSDVRPGGDDGHRGEPGDGAEPGTDVPPKAA
jgi:hypothetical protein